MPDEPQNKQQGTIDISSESVGRAQRKQALRDQIARQWAAMDGHRRDLVRREAQGKLQILLETLLMSRDKPEKLPLISVFASLPSEPDAVAPARYVVGEERLLWPRTEGNSLVFVSAKQQDLRPGGSFGLLEPPADSPVAIPQVMVVPGRAFDRKGNRLGRGGGYYDRAIEMLPRDIVLIGYCLAFQVVDEVPVEPHDRKMDWLVNEEGIFFCRAS